MQENNENVNDQSSEEDPSHKTTWMNGKISFSNVHYLNASRAYELVF